MKNISPLVLILLFLSACSPKEKGNSFSDKKTAEMEIKITELMKQMTLEEKVDLCHAQSKFSTKGVERLGIPELWMSDGPHGIRAEISWDDWAYAGWTNDSITAFPALTCLAATFNPELSGDYGMSLGEEARYRKKDVLLGPGVNIYRTPLNGRNFEYLGEDPFLASSLVVPYIKGVQSNGVAACVKHFALNNQELGRDHINVELSDRALHEIYLPAFKAAVEKAGVWAVMGAYNKFKGEYCCQNDILLNKILKGDWKFDGTVISDWSGAHSTMKAALNGLDIEMGTGTDGLGTTTKGFYQNYYLAKPFLKSLQHGKIDQAVLDNKVRRILRLMYRTTMSKNRPQGKMNNPEHIQTARNVATEGLVLLKNKADFFPIQDKKNLTIAVIGENATRSMTSGGGSSELKPRFEISPLEGLKKRYKNARIIYSKGYASGPSVYDQVIPTTLDADSLKSAALETAQKADLVLFISGLTKSHLQDCEGADRQQYHLPFGQDELLQALLKVNKNLGVILISGNAVAMPWIDQVPAVLQSWYLGSVSGWAIADIVSGDVNPSGKLPFSFPVKLEDNGAHAFGTLSYPGDGINQVYKEDILVGYRWFDTKNIKPLFAFGYGLSYTTFQLSDFHTNKKEFKTDQNIEIEGLLINTGSRSGKEVVQVYVGKLNSKVSRAQKELKAFQKIELGKSEKTKLHFSINTNDLRYYNESTSEWKLEKGEYLIYIGNASNHISQKIKISII
jgi:beta-glucosidase